MKVFWPIFYNVIVLPLIVSSALFISLYQKKMREGLLGRIKAINIIKKYITNNYSNGNVYWFHVSSLGEFYQLKPVIEGMKKVDNTLTNFVSFSSPAGYENAKSEALDLKFYLPIDFFWTASRLINIIKPKKIIFVAYDIWPNLLWTSKIHKIHTTIFALNFRKNSYQLKPVIKSFYKNMYETFDCIYTVSDNDIDTLNNIIDQKKNIITKRLGNPRYDTVFNSGEDFKIKVAEDINERPKRIIVGSTHFEDDKMVIPPLSRLMKMHPDLKIFHIPHEPNINTIKNISSNYYDLGHSPLILNKIDCSKIPRDQIILLKAVGYLSKLYWFAQMGFVGGGMSTGIHNVMEPAIAGIPILFGPKYDHAPEAEELIMSKGGFCVKNAIEFESIIDDFFNNPNKMKNAGEAAKNTIYKNIGISSTIVNCIIYD